MRWREEKDSEKGMRRRRRRKDPKERRMKDSKCSTLRMLN
jgi:hypothetical protein